MSDLSQPLDLHHSLRRATAQARHRHPWTLDELAQQLQVSPGELVAAHAGLHPRHESPLKAVRLQPDWPGTLRDIARWGPVVLDIPSGGFTLSASTRLQGGCTSPEQGTLQALDEALCLHAELRRWAHAFAVQDELHWQVARSVIVFDAQGQTLLQISLSERSDFDAYASWVARSASPSLAPGLQVSRPSPRRAPSPVAHPAPAAVHAAWLATRQAQECAELQTRWGLSRHQLLSLAHPAFVQPVEPTALPDLFMQLAQHQVLWRCQGSQRGLSVDWQGSLLDVRPQGAWLRLAKPGLAWALREHAVTSAWRVRHPTSQGLLSRLELFDADQQPLLCLSSAPHAQAPERRDWHTLLAHAADAAPECTHR